MKLPEYIIKAYKVESIKKGTSIELTEIEAIPVEWIERQANKILACAETVYDITYAKQLLKLIKQWRRENDDHKSG